MKGISLAVVALASAAVTCHSRGANPYESAPPAVVAGWKEVRLPLLAETRFVVSQGAFGKNSHHQSGIEYRWDFDVPYGTPVVAVEAGRVTSVIEPHKGGGCDAKYSEVPNTLTVKHVDGTVAQYTHIESRVVVGAQVAKGDVIAVTAMNGDICTPQLDFLVYRSDQTLYDSPHRESIPLRFAGLPGDERANEGLSAVVPP
jgi:murein DD-endopeptidase MepM/ murein hydrolase activator NlpD